MVHLKQLHEYYAQLNDNVQLVLDMRDTSAKRFTKKVKNLYGLEHLGRFDTLGRLLDEYQTRWLQQHFAKDVTSVLSAMDPEPDPEEERKKKIVRLKDYTTGGLEPWDIRQLATSFHPDPVVMTAALRYMDTLAPQIETMIIVCNSMEIL